MVFSLNRGPQYRPQYIKILIRGGPKKVPLILGNPHFLMQIYVSRNDSCSNVKYQIFMSKWKEDLDSIRAVAISHMPDSGCLGM